MRRYRERHPDRVATYQRRYIDKNPFYRQLWAMENPERHLLNTSRQRARKRGVEHTITLADIVIPTHCPVLGVPLEMYGGVNSPSLDRINSDYGYVPGNVMVISWRANQLKSDATPEEIKKLADFYCGGKP